MRALLSGALLLTSACARLPLVRDCGAVVGDHFSAQSFAWVQPCERSDYEGCANHCRRPASRCEAAQAAYREKPRGQSSEHYERLSREIELAYK